MSKFKITLCKYEYYEVFVDADSIEDAKEYGEISAWDTVDWDSPWFEEYRVCDVEEDVCEQ